MTENLIAARTATRGRESQSPFCPGDEIGMLDVAIPPECIMDPFEKNVPGRGHGRDPERTPMHWSAEPYAGFTTTRPWLPIGPDYAEVNVEAQRQA